MDPIMTMRTAGKNKKRAIKSAVVTAPEFSVKPDRPSHIYFCDEYAVFTICGSGKATIRFTIETVTLLKESFDASFGVSFVDSALRERLGFRL